ncbi:glycosyltransferase 87 family protein [Lentzea flaviverrucosa]|uniref:Alpha-1,2-mannosyltransferase n=1 Tax=Lentzea flaviverrucosa TaxID=200379 RepID=A0A1H9CHW4_9PSEU|nr:glycosyltransferase 87 family protein [Lentzea flaviverrucosa]RDI24553.1 alpha-1,2-mannosyltransferase [Lentzea flaviverrucosa]SEQ00749.1 alpha-1,2-mannosyltransferase [Lentzea flaviverrucosa]
MRNLWGATVAGLLVWVLVRSFGIGVLDLRVYLAGGEAWLAGTDLYTADFHGPRGLPFTYPPFAAMVFGVLAPLPLALTAVLFTAVGIGLFTAAVRRWAGFGLVALCLLLEPLRITLDMGQVNLVLFGLVAADCLLPRPPWPRGLLVGLAAAIKLTPAIFVLFFLCRGRWRPALTAVATFTACGLAGWVLAPGQSKQFWFHAMLDPERVGGLAYSANQSLRGLLFRLGAPEFVWFAGAIALLALTVVLLPRLRDDLTALVAVAAAGLLISPVSWSHHWVWIAPALLLLKGRVRIAVMAVFAVGPHWLLPTAGDRELAWTWWQHVVGNTYVWLGLGFLVWCAWRSVVRDKAERGSHPEPRSAVGF